MKKKLKIFIIFCFFSLFFSSVVGIRKYIQKLPTGPYLQSCKKCMIVNGSLHCQCREVDEEWNSVTLENANHCRYSIVNDHGQLKCLPHGSYLDTCARCWMDGDTLYCMGCKNTRGQTVQILQRFSLPHVSECRYDIVNNNAELNCLPYGPYLKYCSKCNIVDDVLQCHCSMTPHQNWTLPPVSLDLKTCRDGSNIIYSGGQLECLD